MISCGSNVRAAIKAINMASPVNRPKKILGRKLDRARIEKPIMIVTVVYYIA